jgi:AhpD family alkylhydroperoxidase
MKPQSNPHSHPRPRLDLAELAPGPLQALVAAQTALNKGPLPQRVRELVKIRASQLNGCAYCVEMHTRAALAEGESNERLHQVAVWRESLLFSAQERAALAYAEAATHLGAEGVSEAVWAEAQEALEPAALAGLVVQVAVINAFNRIAVPLRTPPGMAPGKPAAHAP